MGLEVGLNQISHLTLFQLGAPGRTKRFQRIADAMHFAGVECQTHRPRAFVTRHHLQRQSQGRLQYFGNIVGAAARRHAADLQYCARCFPLLDTGNSRGLSDADNEIILRRHAQVLEFGAIERHARQAENLLKDQTADEIADSESIRLGYFVDMIRRQQTRRPRHIIDDHRRRSGNMFPHMARDHSRVSIEAATWSQTDDQSNGFAFEKSILRKKNRWQTECRREPQHRQYTSHERNHFSPPSITDYRAHSISRRTRCDSA